MPEIEVARDWLDYVEAFGVVLSLLLAGLAAWFAWRSGRDSQRSADAAERTANAAKEEAERTRILVERVEEQLRIQRDEHALLEQDRSRRPDLRVAIDDNPHIVQTEPAPALVIRATVTNVGDKEASGLLISFRVPRSVGLAPSGPYGDVTEQVSLQPVEGLILRDAGAIGEAHAYNRRVNLPAGQDEAAHLLLRLPHHNFYEVELHATHHEAGSAAARVMIEAPAGGVPTLRSVDV